MVFGVDEIHALRVELAERREKLPKDKADQDFKARVERGRKAIAEARKAKPISQPTTPPQ